MADVRDERVGTEGRRAQIQAAAKRLFFAKGFSATSMEEVAEAAGVSKGLVFHYFGSKEGLLLSFWEETEAYLDGLGRLGDAVAALERFGCDFLVNDERLYASAPPIQVMLIAFAEGEVASRGHELQNPILRDVGRDYLGGFFRLGIAQGAFREGDARAYGDAYWAFLMGKLLAVKRGHESLPPENYVREALAPFRADGTADG